MIRIGIVGFGYLGRVHYGLLKDFCTHFEVVGIHDHSLVAKDLSSAEDFRNLSIFHSYQDLLDAVEAVAIIASTPSHYQLAEKALLLGKAVFVEKPMCARLDEAIQLRTLVGEKKAFLQVGHVERFNPAFRAAASYIGEGKMLYFESKRSAPFQQRGADISVVLDLMIHDIDLLLSISHSRVRSVEVKAIRMHSQYADEVRAELLFEDGLHAILFASRLSAHKERAIHLESTAQLVKLDLLQKTALVEALHEKDEKVLEVLPTNALLEQWQNFADALLAKRPPLVGVEAGYAALDLAYQIDELATAMISQNSEQ